MIEGYKYASDEKSHEWRTISIDSDSEEFGNTMGYFDISTTTPDFFLENFCSHSNVQELHSIYERFLSKERLTVGIGSGYGEHELLLHLKGFPVIASDIIPGLAQKISILFPGFRGCTIDIFKDDVRDVLKKISVRKPLLI